jgi:putative copper export protein
MAPSGMRYKYTTAYVRILLVCVVLFLIALIFGRGQSSDVKDNTKESHTTETSSLNIEKWLLQQDQLNLKEAFAKAGIQ